MGLVIIAEKMGGSGLVSSVGFHVVCLMRCLCSPLDELERIGGVW